MSTVIVVVIVIIVILVAGAVGFLLVSQGRHRRLQAKFGPEYDRAVQSHDSKREAEQELLARQKRHDELEIKELAPEARERHRAEWQQLQERFVDAPESAVTEADHLLVAVMGERGYPTEGYEQQVDDLSVEHAGTIGRYRTAHEIGTRAEAKQASTEDLRQAMVHYRSLFTELLGDAGDHAETRTEAGAERGTGARTKARAETDADQEAGGGRDASGEANGRGLDGQAEETRTGTPATRRDATGDEGVRK